MILTEKALLATMYCMRTIDNLGLPASIRYAKDKEQLDTRLLDESRLIPQKTETSVARPYLVSEFEQQYSLTPKHLFALFQPPPHYFEQGRMLFGHHIVPSLGSDEKRETDIERLTHWTETSTGQKRKSSTRAKSKKEGKKSRTIQEQEDEDEEEERECHRLLSLLQCITQLDKDLLLINARRNQYQRG